MDDRELDGRLGMIQEGIDSIMRLLMQADEPEVNPPSQESTNKGIKLSSRDEEQM